MFSLTQSGQRLPVAEPRSPSPAAPPVPAAPPAAVADDLQDDWPKDVHLPDEEEDDEC